MRPCIWPAYTLCVQCHSSFHAKVPTLVNSCWILRLTRWRLFQQPRMLEHYFDFLNNMSPAGSIILYLKWEKVIVISICDYWCSLHAKAIGYFQYSNSSAGFPQRVEYVFSFHTMYYFSTTIEFHINFSNMIYPE